MPSVRVDPGSFVRVDPDNSDHVASAVELQNLARLHDDPDRLEAIPELVSGLLRYGWDLEPAQMYLYLPVGASRPVGLLEIDLPQRDNLHLVWAGITVLPDHRRLGHGTAIFDEVLRRARAASRSTIWLEAAEDDPGGRTFLETRGFSHASRDARRRQLLADVDHDELARLHAQAHAAATEYVLEKGCAPMQDGLLEELIEVTAAINDAPMGSLTFEDEKFDLQRLQDFETAAAGRGATIYRLWARHRDSGEVAGHTVIATHPLTPQHATQADTAVARKHRGHRLGLLLKIEMLHWFTRDNPAVQVIETWNNVENDHMISVNEAIGYRLSRVFATYELVLD